MRKLNSIIGILLFCWSAVSSQDSLLIQGIKYKADTLIHRHDVGLGTMHTYFSLPDLPLLVNVLEVDAQNPHIQFETCLSHDTIRGLERPSAMALRKSGDGHVAFAAINGDFYNTVSPNQGHPVNGQILQGQVAKKPHSSRPVIAFDHEKNPFIDVMTLSGTLKSGNFTYAISDVNNSRNTNNLILFNSFFGNNTRTNEWGSEAVATMFEGNWSVNQPMKLKIEDLLINKGSTPILGEKVILSGNGDAAAFLNGLQVGDTVELELKTGLKSLPELAPAITELIGGDRTILKDGIVQENNWPELHPRTAIGFSADKSKIIMAVVDGRSNKSKGVSTKQLADIMKLSGAADALNLDGGGSSVMVVHNEIKNTPSDGVERAVANALLVVSNAIPAEEKTMQLNAEHITIPFGKKFQVKASTFDENGEVIKYLTADNMHYHLLGKIGKINEEGWFTASGTAHSGYIVGTWNGTSDTITVKLIPAEEIAISVNTLVIDHLNEYTFKVYGKGANGDTYQMDNDIVHFTSTDTTIGMVNSDGIFRGKTDGVVGIAVSTGIENQTDTCWISVEIGRGRLLLDDFSDPGSWNATLSQIDNVTLTRERHPVYNEEMLKVEYTFTYSNRTASITLSKETDIYGMPDSILMKAAGSGYRTSYYYVIDHPYGLCQVPTFSDSTLQEKKAAIRTSQFKQEDYPIRLVSIRLNVERDQTYVSGNLYTGTFWLKGIYAVYPEKDVTGSLRIAEKKKGFMVFPNPANDEFYIQTAPNQSGMKQLSWYSVNGELIRAGHIFVDEAGKTEYITVKGIQPGMYFLVVYEDNYRLTGKILVVP